MLSRIELSDCGLQCGLSPFSSLTTSYNNFFTNQLTNLCGILSDGNIAILADPGAANKSEKSGTATLRTVPHKASDILDRSGFLLLTP